MAATKTRSGQLDPRLVLRTFHQEIAQRGKRGAYVRAAKRLGCTDERVRQIVRDDERRRQALLETLVMAQPYVTFDVTVWQDDQTPNSRIERELREFRAFVPHDFRREYDISATWGMLQALVLTVLTVAGGWKHVVLGLMLTAVALGAWSVAARWGREARTYRRKR
jgi:hypothetical protein